MPGSHEALPGHRRSIRLQGYDYGQIGAYFVTICGQNRACVFGDVVEGEVRLSVFGQIVNEERAYTELVRSRVILDAYVVMPNHVHGIVVIVNEHHANAVQRAGQDARALDATAHGPHSPSQTIGAVVRGFKAAATTRINGLRDTPRAPIWQRNYYEHVIRNDDSLNRIRAYIANNPGRWAQDEENPLRVKTRGEGLYEDHRHRDLSRL